MARLLKRARIPLYDRVKGLILSLHLLLKGIALMQETTEFSLFIIISVSKCLFIRLHLQFLFIRLLFPSKLILLSPYVLRYQ